MDAAPADMACDTSTASWAAGMDMADSVTAEQVHNAGQPGVRSAMKQLLDAETSSPARLAKKNGQVYAFRRESRNCHPLIGDKRASRDPTPDTVRKGCSSPDSNAGPRDCSRLPYRTWHPWAAGDAHCKQRKVSSGEALAWTTPYDKQF